MTIMYVGEADCEHNDYTTNVKMLSVKNIYVPTW